MKWEMEILSSAPYASQSNWLVEEKSKKWTPKENKMFENALAVYDKDTPDRWHKVAAMIPGKTVADVINQYKELEVDVSKIEAGLVPIPGYDIASPFTLDWVNKPGLGFDGYKGLGGKRSSGRPNDQERKKGVPWTEEEHKLFLLGLKKYGKGDWRNISRNFVITRTPTQVASHAQKYFIRQLSGGKDKRRASIHDITTVSLTDATRTPSPSSEDSKKSASPQDSMMLSRQKQPHFQWNPANAGLAMAAQEKMFISSYGMDSYGIKLEGQNLPGDLHRESSYLGSQTQNLVFQLQSKHQY